jgi:hypothetical protein
LADLHGRDRVYRTHVDQQQLAPIDGHKAVGSADNRLEVRHVWKHDDDHAAPGRDVRRTPPAFGASCHQVIEPGTARVPDHAIPGPQEVVGNELAHDAETDEAQSPTPEGDRRLRRRSTTMLTDPMEALVFRNGQPGATSYPR